MFDLPPLAVRTSATACGQQPRLFVREDLDTVDPLVLCLFTR
jgi:hypothetical protein